MACAAAQDGIETIAWRWYDAVVVKGLEEVERLYTDHDLWRTLT